MNQHPGGWDPQYVSGEVISAHPQVGIGLEGTAAIWTPFQIQVQGTQLKVKGCRAQNICSRHY